MLALKSDKVWVIGGLLVLAGIGLSVFYAKRKTGSDEYLNSIGIDEISVIGTHKASPKFNKRTSTTSRVAHMAAPKS